MIKPEDTNTFNLVFKTTNEGYNYIRSFVDTYCEIISDSILPDTTDLYNNDTKFREIVKEIKKLNDLKVDYIKKNNK